MKIWCGKHPAQGIAISLTVLENVALYRQRIFGVETAPARHPKRTAVGVSI